MAENPNRLLAAVSYLIPIVGSLIVILFDRKNLFALYHACQAVALLLLVIVLPSAWLLLTWAIAWVPMAGPTLSAGAFTIVMVGIVTAIILIIVGIGNALRTKAVPLFLVGRWGERLFIRLYPKAVVESST